MIPSEMVGRAQISNDRAPRPLTQAQEIADKLSQFTAGQRVFAQIQALLPNGNYKAIVNQSEMSLALPFVAKKGDTLELIITDTKGKMGISVLAHLVGGEDGENFTSAPAAFSRTGQFISALLNQGKGGVYEQKAQALPLNNNQPILDAPPKSAGEIAPQLKQALTQSGMFYEAHQAKWLAGKLSQEALLAEPQGKLSSALQNAKADANFAATNERANPTQAALLGQTQAQAPMQTAQNPLTLAAQIMQEKPSLFTTLLRALLPNLLPPLPPENAPAQTSQNAQQSTPNSQNPQNTTQNPPSGNAQNLPQSQSAHQGAQANLNNASLFSAQNVKGQESANAAQPTLLSATQFIAPQTQGIVQQQLSVLAGQQFVWEGQIWAGQNMRWEIEEEREEEREKTDGEEETIGTWKTKLRLHFPKLGGIEAQIIVRGDDISMHLSTGKIDSLAQLRNASDDFKQRLEEAGLQLSNIGIYADLPRLSDENKAEDT